MRKAIPIQDEMVLDPKDPMAFEKWILGSKGRSARYFEGSLAKTREERALAQKEESQLAIARAAWRAAMAGQVVLLQRRVGELRFHYIAVRTRKQAARGKMIG